MTQPIGHGAKIAVLTPDPALYQFIEKALPGYQVSGETQGARVIISDVGTRKCSLPLALPEHVPVIALIPRRTFDLARTLYNAGADDVMVRKAPAGTLRDSVQALLAAAPRRGPQTRPPSTKLHYLRELSEWARQGADLPVLFQKIVDSVADALDVDIVSLMLRETDPEKQKEFLRIQASRGLSDQIVRLAQVEVGQGISGLVAAKGEPLLVQDVEKARLGVAVSNSRYATKSLLSVPIKAVKHTIGVLNVNNKITGVPFDDNDLNLLVTLCNQAGMAIDNARLLTDLRRHADDLEQLNERLKRISQAKSELIINLSHELKTPLTTIQGYIDLLRTGFSDPDKTDDILGRVYDRSNHLGRLTDRLINYFALDAGLTEYRREDFPFGVLLWTCIDEARGFATANKISIDMNVSGIDRHVCADRKMYRELMMALLDNAVKFNRRGGRVRIYGEPIAQEYRPLLEVFIEDTGRGIEQDLREAIFDDFKQTSDIMTAKPDGLGLGLAIARAIAEGHGCTLKLVDTSNEGSTFAFTIPLSIEE